MFSKLVVQKVNTSTKINLCQQTKQWISEHLPRHSDGLAKDEGDRLVGTRWALLFAGQHPHHPHCRAGPRAGVQSWELGASD